MVCCSKKGSSQSFYACSLFISCAITLKIPARCSAQEVHALLLKRWMVVHCCRVEKQVQWSERVFPMRSDWRENKAGLFVLFMQVGSRQAEA